MRRGNIRPIADVLADLVNRRGYGRLQASVAMEQAWQQAAGEAAAGQTRVGPLKRGVLDILVSNSTWIQELAYQKPQLLSKLSAIIPDQNIRDLRFRVG